MKRLLSHLIYLAVTAVLALALGACEDRLDYPGAPIPEGISTVDVGLGYQAFTPALESRASGTAIKEINTLWLVLYDKDGNFKEKREVTSFTNKGLENNSRPDGKPSSELQTGHVEFKLTLPNGYYKMYAVVNHNLATVDDELIDTPEKLKSLDLEWKDGNVAQNAQMFGWFVNGDKNTDHGSDAPVIAIRDNSSSLHAWVRRAASKLTIAFDTQNLKENVYIYLKSITVKDIPRHCYLDRENAVGADGYTLESKLVDGETIYFDGALASHTGKTDHGKWPVIAAGDTVFGLWSDEHGKLPAGTSAEDRLAKEHAEEARALYFYENMQPDGIEGTVTDKRQDVSGNNILVSYPDGTYEGSHDDNGNLVEGAYGEKKGWKDGKQWGSYIEVKAYYENNGGETPGKGDIVYRFMLGKDTRINYEAERNHHYRLTMKFNGNANDIDFHIDYKEEAKPGTFSQDTTYVSYLYNQPATTTVRGTPLPGYDLVKFEAVILENQWIPYPEKETTAYYNTQAWQWQREGTDDYKSQWGTKAQADAKGWVETTDKTTAQGDRFYKADPEMAENTEFGFLSLREVETVTKNFGRNGVDRAVLVQRFRRAYFKADKEPGQKDVGGPLNWREFTDIPKTDGTLTHEDALDGNYTFTRETNPYNPDEVNYVGVLPLYTRAKTLDQWAVYSGANPFTTYQRYAKIKFTAHYTYNPASGKPKVKGDSYTESTYTNVLQARRIDNPRGVYRRYDNDDSFYVSLVYGVPDGKGGETYKEFDSRGPWTATIEQDPDGLVQISANGQSATGKGGSITGRTLTPVKFTYTPRSKLTDFTSSRGAIITVTYHNNSCVHKILVRQGYAPGKIGPNGKHQWSSFNVYDSENLVRSPLSIGSLFRRYKDLSYPILEENNATWGVGVHPKSTDKFKIAGKDATTWKSIPYNGTAADEAFAGTIELNNHILEGKSKYVLPTFNDITELGIVDGDNQGQTVNPYANDYNYAFGITYADGARSTLLTSDAYSYSDPKNEGKDSKCGVHGVIVYSKSNGDNVHFPLGATGHARRKSRGLNTDGTSTHIESYGYMRYGSVDYRLTGTANNYRPMAWDLPSQKGAGYWINSGTKYGIAMDFNYGNYMAYYLNKDDLYLMNGSPDALPVRLIKKE